MLETPGPEDIYGGNMEVWGRASPRDRLHVLPETELRGGATHPLQLDNGTTGAGHGAAVFSVLSAGDGLCSGPIFPCSSPHPFL